MQMYVVPIVREEFRSLWHEFRDEPGPSERAKLANVDGSLDRTAQVRAENVSEAAARAESCNPGYVAVRHYVQRVR